MVATPLTDGVHGQVATLLGLLPEVTRTLHVEILFPFTKNITREVTLTVNEIVTTTPFAGTAERDGV